MGKKGISLITLIISISILLLNGSCTSSKSEKNDKDPKQLLTEAVKVIEQLAQENRDLKASIDNTKKGRLSLSTSSIIKELAQSKKDNESLQDELNTLKGRMAYLELQLEALDAVSSRVPGLEETNRHLQKELSKQKGMLSFSRIQLEAKEIEVARILEVEKENKELKTILEKINLITNALDTGTPTTPAQ